MMNKCHTLRNTIFKYVKVNRALSTNADNDLRIEYLKQSLVAYDKPNCYESLVLRNSKIERLKRCTILIPITVRIVRNNRGNYVQKTFYTFLKRPSGSGPLCGEVSFIGGDVDADVDGVMKKAYDEVGIDPARLTLLARLHPLFARVQNDRYLVTPVVAHFDEENFKPNLNLQKVQTLFQVDTLKFLLDESHRCSTSKSHTGVQQYVHYFDHRLQCGTNIPIWGWTSLISIGLSSMIHSRTPEFMVDPAMQINGLNLNQFLDFYLFEKCLTEL